ncbi:MAG TPA: hypothetical protein VIY49_19220 [Bryobacteraceae bacterium]
MRKRTQIDNARLRELDSALKEWQASEQGRKLSQELAQFNRETLSYMADVLHRLGIDGDLGAHPFSKEAMLLAQQAWKRLCLPKNLFPDQQPWLVFKLIEEPLDLLARLGKPSSPDAAGFSNWLAGKQGGQPTAKYEIDVDKLYRLCPRAG